ncbi:hypothetical protein HPB50_028283 [Hyalomma asiaticum]|nr:hypothetical protein HPB50_028283 [Hyalomma asiaticum]
MGNVATRQCSVVRLKRKRKLSVLWLCCQDGIDDHRAIRDRRDESATDVRDGLGSEESRGARELVAEFFDPPALSCRRRSGVCAFVYDGIEELPDGDQLRFLDLEVGFSAEEIH